MDSCDDIFAISDEEMPMPLQTAQSNPVEEYLLKQLTDVQSRIDNATSEIANMRENTARILNALQWRALYGENPSSDSDTDVSRSSLMLFSIMFNSAILAMDQLDPSGFSFFFL